MRTADHLPPEAASEPGPASVLAWALQQERLLLDRLDRLHVQEEALRQYDALRARLCWAEDRRCEAEELAAKLPKKPASIRARLARDKHGVLWLMDRWKALGAVLDRESGWNDVQVSLAFDLLGIDPCLRAGDPWTSAGLATPRALVDRELKALELSLLRTLNRLDELEQAQAIACCPVRPSSAMKALKREESACWRRLLAVQKLLKEEPAPELGSKPAEAAPAPVPVPAPPSALPTRPLQPPAPAGNRRARRAARKLQRS